MHSLQLEDLCKIKMGVDYWFQQYLGNCTVLDCDLWGIFDGLKLVQDQGIERI